MAVKALYTDVKGYSRMGCVDDLSELSDYSLKRADRFPDNPEAILLVLDGSEDQCTIGYTAFLTLERAFPRDSRNAGLRTLVERVASLGLSESQV